MADWKTVKLETVGCFQNGEAFSSAYFNLEKKGLRLVRNRDLKNDDQIVYYDGLHSDHDVVSDGDLLVGMDGDFTPVIWKKGKALLNQRVGRVLIKDGASQEYIYYALFSALAELEHVTSATTVKHLSSKTCLGLEIPLPPLAEQRKIAEILRTWDEAIETAEAELKAKQERKRWLMHKLLTCPSEHNGALHQNTWTTVGLGEVASFQNGEAFSSRFFNSENRGLRLVRNRDLKNDDQIIFYDGEYSAKDVVSDGDLLVGMDGDFTPVIWSKGKALLNQRVGRITVKPEISKSYIYYTLYSVLTELEHVTSATTVKHLSSKGCLLLKIPMPPFTSQCLISGILQSADADIQVITQRIESLRTQKRGLMQKLLTGEVRVAA